MHQPSACFHAVVSGADVTGPVIFSPFPLHTLCAPPLCRPITIREQLAKQAIKKAVYPLK